MRSKARSDGWWYPWIFVGGMTIVVVVNGLLAYFAVSTYSGLETEGHFEKGIAYNKNLAAARAQQELGWSLSTALTTESQTDGVYLAVVQAALQDRNNNPVIGLMVNAILSRPTEQGLDQTVSLIERAPGLYQAQVQLPKPGRWDLRVIASGGPVPYQDIRRLMVKSP